MSLLFSVPPPLSSSTELPYRPFSSWVGSHVDLTFGSVRLAPPYPMHTRYLVNSDSHDCN